MSYVPKTTPFAHQREIFEATKDLKSYGLWWEMGCGKTKPMIDTAAYLYERGEVDAVLVLAPKAVAPNWIHDELPTHMPDRVPVRSFLYVSERATTKKFQRELEDALRHEGLLFVAMSYDAIMTSTGKVKPKKGKELAQYVLKERKCLYVLDESARIKSPGTKRSIRVLSSAPYAKYRRVLTGTPLTNSPFDAYAQVKFLDPTIWPGIGCAQFAAFKSRFGVFEERQRSDNGQRFTDTVGYRDLDKLAEVVASVGDRKLKSDVLDLPPKLYGKRFFDMSREQKQLYDALRRDFIAFLDSGEIITAPLMITRLLRLQQVTSGYCPVDDLEVEGKQVMERIEPNPRLACLAELCEDVPHKAIIWAKFREDLDQIMDLLGSEAVRYDGTCGHDARERARREFQEGDAKWFVGNPACAGEGLTLHAAQTVIYYNNSFKLADRLQSEDRAHRIGQEHPVNYVDVIASGTIDHRIVVALREKLSLSRVVMGDKFREWI